MGEGLHLAERSGQSGSRHGTSIERAREKVSIDPAGKTQTKRSITTLVILPTLDECENLKRLIPALLQVDKSVDILVVDDKSSDGTGAVADRFASETDRVHNLHRPIRMGMGSAYLDGFKYALRNTDVQYIIEMYADFSHDPACLPAFLRAIHDADLVVGARPLDGIGILNRPLSRLARSKIGNWYARGVTGLPVSDVTAGFICMRRTVLESLDLDTIRSGGSSFQIELAYTAWKKGFRVAEVPITFVDRKKSGSKLRFGTLWEAIWRVWALRFRHLLGKI